MLASDDADQDLNKSCNDALLSRADELLGGARENAFYISGSQGEVL
jgi:hypothetical protein